MEAWRKQSKSLIDTLRDNVRITYVTTGLIDRLVQIKQGNIFFRDSSLGTLLFYLASIFLLLINKCIIVSLNPSDVRLYLLTYVLRNKRICNIHKTNYFGRINKRYLNVVAEKLKLIIVSTEEEKNALIQLGINSEKLFILRPSIHGTKYANLKEPLNKNIIRVLFASAPMEENDFVDKNIKNLIEGFSKFSAVRLSQLFIVCRNGCCVERIENMIKNSEQGDKIKAIDGLIDIKKFLKICHVAVVLSKSTRTTPPYPRSLIESLAAGRPIIATRCLSISSIIESEECGVSCGTSAEAFCEALMKVDSYYDEYLVNTRRTAYKYFSVTNEIKVAARLKKMDY